MSNFIKRTITGALFVIAIIGAILWNQYSFLFLFFVINLLSTWEFYHLLQKNNIRLLKIYGCFLSGIIYLLFSFVALNYIDIEYLWTVIPLILSLFIIEIFRKDANALVQIGYTILGLLYIAIPFSLFVLIAFIDKTYQSTPLIGILMIIWIYDTFAYIVGKNIGKHKLFERISPKKTWEGLIGGSVVSIFAAYMISVYFNQLALIDWIIIAIITIIFGTLGDLFESLMKRGFNYKDSGNLLPGHGGLLDRFDAFLFVIPLVYYHLLITKI